MEGASLNPCSDTYCGPEGNSEQETLALDAILEREAPNARAYVTFHSYGYMWMHPNGNTVNNAGFVCERAETHDEMVRGLCKVALAYLLFFTVSHSMISFSQ